MRISVEFAILIGLLLAYDSFARASEPGDVRRGGKQDHAKQDHFTSLGQGIRLETARIPAWKGAGVDWAPFQLEPNGRRLTASDCTCRAASACESARMWEAEADAMCRELRESPHHGPSELLPAILRDRAASERNAAAQDSLVVYFQLVDVHLQAQILGTGYDELVRVRRTIDRLKGAGLPIRVDVSDLDRRRTELDQQRARLQISEVRLTAQLKSLLGETPFSRGAIETRVMLEPRPPPYALDEAIEVARRHDFQLNSIRRFLQHGEEDDLQTANALLRGVDPLLASEAPNAGILGKLSRLFRHTSNEEEEWSVRKAQLRNLLRSRRQQVDLQVANALAMVKQRFVQVTIAKDAYERWQHRVATVESQRELQNTNYEDVVDARRGRLEARADLFHEVVLLEIEHVKLLGAMGVFSDPCASTAAARATETSVPLPAPRHIPELAR